MTPDGSSIGVDFTDVANSYDANDHGIVNWWNKFETIFVDQNDVVWIGVEQIGLITFDGTTWTTVANNPLTRVLEIGEDSNGDLWYTGVFNTSIIKERLIKRIRILKQEIRDEKYALISSFLNDFLTLPLSQSNFKGCF